jgi:hypothetical protein
LGGVEGTESEKSFCRSTPNAKTSAGGEGPLPWKIVGVQIAVETVERVEKEHGVQDTKDNELFLMKNELIGAIEHFGKGFTGDVGRYKARPVCSVDVDKGASDRGHKDGMS